jgi:YVTN family beta-propeller protein
MLRTACFIILISSGLVIGCSREPAAPEPAAAPAPVGGDRIYVTNEISGDMTVIHVPTKQVVATIPLGKRPRGIRLSPDGSTLYVALSGSPLAPPGVDEKTLPPPDRSADGIGVFDIASQTLLRVIPSGTDPEQLAVSSDGTRLFIANEDAAQVSVVQAADGKVITTIKVGGEPEGVDLRPDGKVVYVTSEEDNAVFAIDAVEPKLIAKIDVGPRPRSTGFLPDSSRAYVSAENGAAVTVIDAMKHRVLSTITLTGELMRPMGVVPSPDGRLLFVTSGRGKSLVIIDTATNMPVGAVEVGERPWGLAVSPDGSTVFTANGPSQDVSFVDVASRTVTAKVKAGDRPWGVAYVPAATR